MAAAAPAGKAAAAPARAPRRRRPALAAAPARKAPARKAPARKPAPARRRAPTRRPGGQLIPLAVGTATAVRHLPDSSLMVRMTRGRAWIGVLGVLLVGIVALNVVTLSLAATAGHDRPEHPGARPGELDPAQPRRPAVGRRADPPRRRRRSA